MDNSLSRKIHDMAIECGYDGCGIIPLSALEGYKERFEERLAKTPGSEMVYGKLYELLTNTQELFPWAKSIIIGTIWMGKYRYPASLQGKYAKAFFLSVDTVPESPAYKKKTRFESWMREQGIKFAGGEENAPSMLLPLRQAAVAAGLGIFRQNNFFYGPKGSYYELVGYLTDRECEYINECKVRPCPPKCGLCRKACKTHALFEPYTMHPLSCVSFWTTFGGGVVPPHLQETDFGTWICGCDACQDACPHNRHDWTVGESFYGLDELTELLEPGNIISAPAEELRDRVIPKTAMHIPPDKVDVLRICAERSMKNEAAAAQQ